MFLRDKFTPREWNYLSTFYLIGASVCQCVRVHSITWEHRCQFHQHFSSSFYMLWSQKRKIILTLTWKINSFIFIFSSKNWIKWLRFFLFPNRFYISNLFKRSSLKIFGNIFLQLSQLTKMINYNFEQVTIDMPIKKNP